MTTPKRKRLEFSPATKRKAYDLRGENKPKRKRKIQSRNTLTKEARAKANEWRERNARR